MRVRAQDSNGDYRFGHGGTDFLVDSPDAVKQLVLTGLRLIQGEWFLDKSAGMPWLTEVIGKNTIPFYDTAIRNQILNTRGVTGIENYSSRLDETRRRLTIPDTVRVNTQFGTTTLGQVTV